MNPRMRFGKSFKYTLRMKISLLDKNLRLSMKLRPNFEHDLNYDCWKETNVLVFQFAKELEREQRHTCLLQCR